MNLYSAYCSDRLWHAEDTNETKGYQDLLWESVKRDISVKFF